MYYLQKVSSGIQVSEYTLVQNLVLAFGRDAAKRDARHLSVVVALHKTLGLRDFHTCWRLYAPLSRNQKNAHLS